MSGWIIPAPFANPTMRPLFPACRNVAAATFGPASVVRIARDAASSPDGESRAIAAGRASRTRASGRGTPMTPVDARKTSSGGQSKSRAAPCRTRRAARTPISPVSAFAQPEFTTAARTRPPDRASAARERDTGAAENRFFVKRAAAVAPDGASRIARSGRRFRMPERIPDARNPFGSFIAGPAPRGSAAGPPSPLPRRASATCRRSSRGGRERAPRRARHDLRA